MIANDTNKELAELIAAKEDCFIEKKRQLDMARDIVIALQKECNLLEREFLELVYELKKAK